VSPLLKTNAIVGPFLKLCRATRSVKYQPSFQPIGHSRACPHFNFTGTRSTCAISLCRIEVVCPSSQSMLTPLQAVPTTVPRSVVLAPQQTRSPTLRSLDCSPVILILPDAQLDQFACRSLEILRQLSPMPRPLRQGLPMKEENCLFRSCVLFATTGQQIYPNQTESNPKMRGPL